MMWKRSIALFVALAILAVSGGTALAAEKAWKLAHIRPEGTAIDVALKKFAATVLEKSNGKIKIDIYPASQLGDYTTVQERVSIGDVEMQCAPMSTSVVREMGITGFPYLVRNWAEATKVFAPDSAMVRIVNDYMKQQDLHVIGTWPMYFGGILLTKEPPAPKDPYANQGLKIRIPPIITYEAMAEGVGYQATPLPWADTFTALQTGIVDGVIGGGAEGYLASFRDLAKYFLAVNDHFECWYFYINTDLWKKLPEADRKVLSDAATEMCLERWKVAEQDEIDNMKKMEDLGVKVIRYTDEELAKFREKIMKEGWPKLFKEVPEKDVRESISVIQ